MLVGTAIRSMRSSSERNQTVDGSWNEWARRLRVMAHPARLAILEALAERSQCVKDLNALVSVPQPHLSQHMAALRRAGLVASHSDGVLRCYYLLRPSLVRELIRLVHRKHPVRRRSRIDVQREARARTNRRKLLRAAAGKR